MKNGAAAVPVVIFFYRNNRDAAETAPTVQKLNNPFSLLLFKPSRSEGALLISSLHKTVHNLSGFDALFFLSSK